MVVIDDVRKLAKMQETLLERAIGDRQVNLEKYKDTVKQIDTYAFSDLLNEINHDNKHNQTLEDELRFLEQIKSSYDQLLEQQLSFKRICELYGDDRLELSDLSQINIEYIDNRVNAINGYLINNKNIDNNKNRLEELSEQLITEEKNRDNLSKRLLEFENSLRDNFRNAEGRWLVDGQLQYTSVISEYKEIDFDFNRLLEDTDNLEELLSIVNSERLDTEEKLRAAEICYNSVPSSDSKQILNDITKEYLKVRYRLTLLKILELLSKSYDNYDLFKEKREKLLDLIKYRSICLDKLGIKISIDPFARTRVSEQLDMVSSLNDNSKNINRIKKEIAELSQRVDEMITQNSMYMVELNNTEDLVVSKTSINDIDISSVSLELDNYFDEKEVLDNQVVSVTILPVLFNIKRAREKARSVVKRCNEMVNTVVEDKKKEDILSPELVIVPQPVVSESVNKKEEIKEESSEDLFKNWSLSFPSSVDEVMEEKVKEPASDENLYDEVKDIFPDFLGDKLVVGESNVIDETVSLNNDETGPVSVTYDSDIFTTVDPFIEAPLFTDRTEENIEEQVTPVVTNSSDSVKVEDLFFKDFEDLNKKEENELQLEYNDNLGDEMPDAFWTVQEENSLEDENDIEEVMSFDEQINALLADENSVKSRKLTA